MMEPIASQIPDEKLKNQKQIQKKQTFTMTRWINDPKYFIFAIVKHAHEKISHGRTMKVKQE